MASFVDVTVEQPDRSLDINLKGVLPVRPGRRAMIRTGVHGTIVNTASMAAKQGRVPFLADYVASKFGVLGLTQAMAFELAAYHITVNSVCPGFVATPMQSRELEWEARLSGSTPEGVRQSWIDATPLGRLQTPTTSRAPWRSWSPKMPASSPERRCRSTAVPTWTESTHAPHPLDPSGQRRGP